MQFGERQRLSQSAVTRGAKQKRVTDRPSCACGCGQQVASATARYLSHHAIRRRGASPLTTVELAATLAQRCRTACAFCNWSFEGSVEEGHREFLAHRTTLQRIRAA